MTKTLFPDLSIGDFIPLVPEHYSLLAPYFLNQPFRLAEYCLSLLVAWRDVGDWSIRFAIDQETLFMVARDKSQASHDHLALPIPTDGFSPEKLVALAEHLGLREFHYVPQAYIERHSLEAVKRVFTVTEQPAYEDYIYDSRALAELSGRRFSKKETLLTSLSENLLNRAGCALS